MFQWNASRSLHYDTLFDWWDRSQYDLIIVQEIISRMTNEWSSPTWHIVHGVDKFASVLIMVRSALISKNLISMTYHIPGRILQVRLHLYRTHDIYAVYQQAWNSSGDTHNVLQKRKRIWICLQGYVNQNPKWYLFLICGDFNIPFALDNHQLFIQDPRCSIKQGPLSIICSQPSIDCNTYQTSLSTNLPPRRAQIPH